MKNQSENKVYTLAEVLGKHTIAELKQMTQVLEVKVLSKPHVTQRFNDISFSFIRVFLSFYIILQAIKTNSINYEKIFTTIHNFAAIVNNKFCTTKRF